MINNNDSSILLHYFSTILKRYRFGFEYAVLKIEYFPLEDRYFLGARGAYQIQFDLGQKLSYCMDGDLFCKKIGLIPTWNDPVC